MLVSILWTQLLCESDEVKEKEERETNIRRTFGNKQGERERKDYNLVFICVSYSTCLSLSQFGTHSAVR